MIICLRLQVARLEKEFELLKSRGGEAVTKAYDKGKAEALNDVLVVADNFERAAAAISAETDGERAVVAYYKDAYDTMMGCLKGLGLTEVETVSIFSPSVSVNTGPVFVFARWCDNLRRYLTVMKITVRCENMVWRLLASEVAFGVFMKYE